jgi:hypothetical protein
MHRRDPPGLHLLPETWPFDLEILEYLKRRHEGRVTAAEGCPVHAIQVADDPAG